MSFCDYNIAATLSLYNTFGGNVSTLIRPICSYYVDGSKGRYKFMLLTVKL